MRILLTLVVLGGLTIGFPVRAMAVCTDFTTTLSHDLNVSFAQLCGGGQVTIRFDHPSRNTSLTNLVITEDLGSSGLVYVPGTTSFFVGNGSPPAPLEPTVSGSVLTWDLGSYILLASTNRFTQYLTVNFQVTRGDEGLITANRAVAATISYATINERNGVTSCSDTDSTGNQVLTLKEPVPTIAKTGRNVDAGMSTAQYVSSVFGNVDDDVIWRIHVTNNGQAPLQDLTFDDLMQTGNLDVNYACASEAAASALAANDGAGPVTGCIAAGNSINNFDVDNPFGNPATDVPDLVDIPPRGSTDIFLVGKVIDSCSARTTNTVSDVQWGCEINPPAGGITVTSTGNTPGTASASLSTFSDVNGLNITTTITGINTSQHLGSNGRVQITIRNNSGGTVKGINLRDVLPVEYVVDPTFTPTLTVTPAYGSYPGMTDRIAWTNPEPGTFPLTTTDPALPLRNTAPELRLYSSTVHPQHPDHVDLLRHGDQLVVDFRIVLIRSGSFDRTANLDVRTEDPLSTPPLTDPDNPTRVTNALYVDYQDFCAPGVIKHPPTNPLVTFPATNPEDIDVDLVNPAPTPIFILTNSEDLPLQVALTNHGGHDAQDYYAYVTFGAMMDVVSTPASCSVAPLLHEPWRLPAPIPASGTTYRCDGSAIGTIAPNQTRQLNFLVRKSTDPADLLTDDLTFRADVVGESTLSDGTPLWFPVVVPRADGVTDRANNYSLDGLRARVIGFNLLKTQVGTCSENNPPPALPDQLVQIGEECTYHIDTGGWFGFQTPGFTYIAVQDIQVVDQLPDGQGYISSTDPYATSSSAILGVALNPPGLAPLDEGWIDWTFNRVVPAERITEKDHWFRVDTTARLLNDPLNDNSNLPNRHAELSSNILNSTFQAVFENASTGLEETYNLGPTTVGYPGEVMRRVDLTVSEPNLIVVKEVCNESLYGVGPACSNFVPLADDGDAGSSYIYRLTVSNEANSNGVDRAPAYDVTVTDDLDPSDLAYVLPFAVDGLDNDGDGLSDGGDIEGTIGDNTVSNGLPAQITFSHTDSAALKRIDPGAAVQLYYRVDYDDNAAPLQTFTNSAVAIYDSLEGDSGNQSAPQQPGGVAGGARLYTSAPGSAAVRILPVQTLPKSVVALAHTPLAAAPALQGVTIGEELDYQLDALLPVALLRNFVIRDELPAGLTCSEAPSIDLGAGPYAAAGFVPGGVITPTCAGGAVQWNFGDQRVTYGAAGGLYDLPLHFIARVDNSAATNGGNILANGSPATVATLSYIDETGNPVVLDFGQVDVEIREPQVALTKAFVAATADAADRLTVTVTASNTGTGDACNLQILDDLTGLDLTYVPGSTGGAEPPDSVDLVTFGPNRPLFIWNPDRPVPPGGAFSFTFVVTVDAGVEPQEVLDNTIAGSWTSLPGTTTALNSGGTIGAAGSVSGMRVGSIPAAGDPVNDYETATSTQISVPPPIFTKTDLAPSAEPAIGAVRSFELAVTLPEGVSEGIVVTDSLNAAGLSFVLENNATYDIAYIFEGIATINGQAPSEAAFLAFPADGATGTVSWNIGRVVTASEDDSSTSAVTPRIRIVYYARINNDLDTDAGDLLQNNALLAYRHGETLATENLAAAVPAVSVVEPLLSVSKTVRNATPGKLDADPAAGGDQLEYVVTLANSGNGTAFDVNLVDTLSAGQALSPAFTPTATIGGAAVAGFIPAPANAPGGPLLWGRGNGDDSLDIPPGADLVLTYQVVVVEPGAAVGNSVLADWTSLDGSDPRERSGAGCPAWTAPNDYCTGPAVTSTPTVDDTAFTKAFVADTFATAPWSTAADALARVGDIVTFQLNLNLHGGLTRAVTAQDILPAGTAFAGTVSINGDTAADYTPPLTGAGSNFSYAPLTAAAVPAIDATGTITWSFGDVVNDPFGDPTTDTLVILYRVRILADAGLPQVASMTLSNSAALSYLGGTPLTDSADVTLLQPLLSVTKTAAPAGGDTILAAGELIDYTVAIRNDGGAPAYDVVLEDVLPFGVRNGAATVTMVSTGLASGAALPNLAPNYDPVTGVALWNFGAAQVIPAGDTLLVVYRVQADPDLGADLTLTNQARVVFYYSFDDADTPTLGGVSGVRQVYGPTNTAGTTLTTDGPGALAKQNPVPAEAAIGEPFTYQITVPATPLPVALHDVRILDDLTTSAADLRFVSVAKNSGSLPWTPVNTGSDTSLVIEDPVNGIDIPAGEQIILDVTVVLLDTANNFSGQTFTNSADYTYNRIDGDAASEAAGGGDTTTPMTIVGPDLLTLQKSGPATLRLGTTGTFTLDVHNPSTGSAWVPTLVDLLPQGPQGGMCAAAPTNISAGFFLADGTTPAAPALVAGTDFTVSFAAAPTCQLEITLLPAAGPLSPDQRLIVRYDAVFDPGTVNGAALTNIAGVTSWQSADPTTAVSPRSYSFGLSDGTVGTLDHEDAHTVIAQGPILAFSKSVTNLTTGADPGSDATPGDTLRYTVVVSNLGLTGTTFDIVDDLDRLNTVPAFAPGTLVLVNAGGGDSTATSGTGGSKGTGLVDIRNLAIGPQGAVDDTLTIIFDVVLAPVLASGTTVLNQAELLANGLPVAVSDDPNINGVDDPAVSGDEDPTATLITSAPAFEVWKTSAVLTGGPALMAGEQLRYTLTISNTGNEDAINATLTDTIPVNTTYVAGSTTLNGVAVADPAPGVSPLEAGMLIHTPADPTPGLLPGGGSAVATITFDVQVDPSAMNGLVLENQGFLAAAGSGSGAQPQTPSDDPDTATLLDPTRDVVGNLPLLAAVKTVTISQDLGSPGIVDPGDRLRYTIAIDNYGAIPATGVVLTDPVPANTTYVANSLRVNGAALVPDGGISPLGAGLPLQSADNPGPGIVSAGGSVLVTFEVQVDAGTPTGTLISNQGSVASAELPALLTDADGLPANGYQPTVVVVGDAQLLAITKEVQVVGGGVATAGGELDYLIRVTNIGSLTATAVVISDDLAPLAGMATYVAGSATVNGVASGIVYAGTTLTADYGDLAPGATVLVRFRVRIDPALAIGTTLVNTANVAWNSPVQNAAATVSLDLGGTPGIAALNGLLWHDADFDRLFSGSEIALAGWTVTLYRNGQPVATTLSGAGGAYRFGGVVPNAGTPELYEIRFAAPGAGPNTAMLGSADSPFTNGLQRILDISVASGGNLLGLNLPITPNGAVYDSVVRSPVAGATLVLNSAATGTALPAACFDDPAQQGQVTTPNGYYKFDLNFSAPACPSGGDYLIAVTAPATGYQPAPSLVIPPASDATTAPFSVPACPSSAADAVPATGSICEVTVYPAIPPLSVLPGTPGTVYHLHLTLDTGTSQVFNNPIPLDPELDEAVAITKTASRINVHKGDLVPYTIRVNNVYGVPLYNISIVDTFPAGFHYVPGSARLDGVANEPAVSGLQLSWAIADLPFNASRTIQLLLSVGAGVSEGEYVNRARVFAVTGGNASGEATATVRVVPDATFDCTDVIGKVFDDRDLNGRQDDGEQGLAGVRVVTARGLAATSDAHGRFHITCAAVPDEDRGSNFILKVDDRSLPTGFRLTTENPRVQRATRGKMLHFDFGATIHRVVAIDIAAGVFEPDGTDLRLQWQPKIDQLLQELHKAPSVLRLSYLADIEPERLVRKRLKALEKEIARRWRKEDGAYRLDVETEVFWRRGGPP